MLDPLYSIAPLAPLALLWLAQVATPGPNFVRISHAALNLSRSTALATAAGTAIGNSLWCAAAACGAAALIGEGVVGQVVRLVGTIYLAWIGFQFLREARRPRNDAILTTKPASAPGQSHLTAARKGLATSLTNPQSALFFATFFVAAMPQAAEAWLFVAAVIVVGLVTIAWYGFVVTVLVIPRARRIYFRARHPIDAIFGILLIGMALRLASRI